MFKFFAKIWERKTGTNKKSVIRCLSFFLLSRYSKGELFDLIIPEKWDNHWEAKIVPAKRKVWKKFLPFISKNLAPNDKHFSNFISVFFRKNISVYRDTSRLWTIWTIINLNWRTRVCWFWTLNSVQYLLLQISQSECVLSSKRFSVKYFLDSITCIQYFLTCF